MALQYQGFANPPLGGGLEDFFSPFFTGGLIASCVPLGVPGSVQAHQRSAEHGSATAAALLAVNPD
jgi:hypothetical protein